MDITKVLPKIVKIQDAKGKVYEQQVWYEWKPMFCQKCLQVGDSCQDNPPLPPLGKDRVKGKKGSGNKLDRKIKAKIRLKTYKMI